MPSSIRSRIDPKLVLALLALYLIWGSTYLAIDIAVQTIPPALMCGLRFSIAGVVMLAVCTLTGRTIFYSPQQIARAAVVGLVKSLANEFGKDGILVNNVGPGFTATDRLKELAHARSAALGKTEKEIFEGWAADTALKRLGEPRELADTIVWLASERASYITGQTILVDGGLYKGL